MSPFSGLDTLMRDGEREAFGSSIPLDKALGCEVLLAYEMNGEDLPLVHGCPLRVVVPGYIGARSVKWLSDICVQDCPSDNHFQQVGYKLFPPHINMYNVDYHEGMQLTKLPVNSVIVRPEDRSLLPAGKIAVEGYAMSDGEHEITWVTRLARWRRNLAARRVPQRAAALDLAALARRVRAAAGAA